MSKPLPLPKFKSIDPVQHKIRAEFTPSVEAAALGLRKYHVLGKKGVLSIVLTQVTNPETRREENALLLANIRDPMQRHAFVLLSQLYQAIDTGTAHAVVEAAVEMAPRLFGFVTQNDVSLVCDALLEFGDDLRKAKPVQNLGTRDWLNALSQDGFETRHDGQQVN